MNWTKIRNEYINGHISLRKLAAKHGVSESYIMEKAAKEKWTDKRKKQRSKINEKTEQKTAEKIAEQQSDLAANINKAANELLEKLNIAIQQTDLFIERTKIKAPTKVKDKQGNVRDAFMEREEISLSKKDGINLEAVKQIAGALKDLQAMTTSGKEKGETSNEPPSININISAATAEDIEEE